MTFDKIDMSSDPGTPTLDQLRVFLTVAEVGSFAGAATALGACSTGGNGLRYPCSSRQWPGGSKLINLVRQLAD